MNCRDVLLQVIFSGKSVLAHIALPVSSLLFLQFSIFAEGDATTRYDGLIGDGVAERDTAVFVFAVQSRRISFPFLFGIGPLFVHTRDVALQRHDAAVNLKS